MVSSSKKSATEEAKSSVKRKPKDDLRNKPMFLKKHKEEVAVKMKRIFVGRLPTHVGIADIFDFFKDVGQVVRVQFGVRSGLSISNRCAFVDFASSNEAEKAVQKLDTLQTFGDSFTNCNPRRPNYCKDHKVWNKDYIIREEDETPPNFVENVVFVSNLSPQTKLFHILDHFSSVGEVVSVRLIVNPEGKHVGYGFVEFGSAHAAHRALQLMNRKYLHDHMLFLDVAKLPPYRLLPKFNLAEKLCYQDYLRRRVIKGILDETSDEEEEEEEEGPDKTPSFLQALAVRRKTIWITLVSRPIEIQDIIDLYKDVGQVVHVRLLVDCEGNPNGNAFIEFASAKEAEKALEKKYWRGQEYYRFSAEKFPNPHSHYPMNCLDHNVWYEEQLGRENSLIDEAVEEGYDFAEEVASRKKTLFVYNLPPNIRKYNISNYYNRVGEVRRVRLVVNREGEHVGCGFVEFASAVEANKALLCESPNTNMHFISDVVQMPPYPIRPKYNLAEKLWNEEYLVPEEIEGDYLELEKPEVTKLFCGKKTTFSDDD